MGYAVLNFQLAAFSFLTPTYHRREYNWLSKSLIVRNRKIDLEVSNHQQVKINF